MVDFLISKKTLHFIGIGGSGMSSLALFAKKRGINVTGSDRSFDRKENKELFTNLFNEGIILFPQ
ncbi:MAG: Mur ligase domain-containing protein, partial [Thermodesulfobacteriota bacterium]|nr:Mur ligase domain-containing protein [Thermodesulfobacteriota bacterium]